jgi:DNA-binding transcriptional LysR family regulator
VRALDMAPLVRDGLVSVERAVGPQTFMPETSARQFCIAATDYMTAVVLPHFLRALAALAPHAGVTILPATRIDLTAQIDVGRIEVALGSFSNIPHRLRAEMLFEERDVVMVAPDHPLASGTITLDQLSALPLFVVSAGGSEDGLISERGLTRRTEMFDRAALEQAFGEIGKTPDLKVIQPHSLAIPSLLAGTSAAAIAPAHLAGVFLRSGSVAVSELPWAAPPCAVQMVWHERNTRDPGHKWLRGMLEDAARRVNGASAEMSAW